MMHGHEKSDDAIVAVKPTNKAERSAAEPVEPRAEAKGNAGQRSTHRAQYRERVAQALACIRRIIAVDTRGGSRMRESCTYGSVRGAPSNGRPYRDRREFITLLGGAAAAWPLAARAQQSAMPVVGFLRADTPAAGANVVAAFRKGLSETGFVEGRNLAIEFRWGQNDRDRLPELAADLVRRKVDVIAAPQGAVGALAAKALTTTIPIVFGTSGDPVQLGLVASLNRPGANVTGFVDMGSELVPKELGLLHELLPAAARFGVLLTRTFYGVDGVTKDAQTAAAAIGRQVDILFAGTDREIDAAFADLVQKRLDALLVTEDVVLAGRQTQILTLAARHALPAIYSSRAWADAGGLMSYGPLLHDQARQVGIYTGRVLKGEKPADLPVARATKFEFVINLATARAIGLTVPVTLLASADEVIE